MKKFTRELLVALLAHALVLAWVYRGPLTSGQVDAAHAHPPAFPQALENMQEMTYMLLPALAAQSQELHAGVFPAWSPQSQGGTPLIGKMQNAVFAPYHIPLYALPQSWMPWVLTFIIFLKSFLIFLFTWLYCRSLKLSAWAGILAGELFVLPVLNGGLFSWFGISAYLPLLLLLAELQSTPHRRLGLLLWPWAVAFTFFSGHFESAFWINASAGAYLALRLKGDWKRVGLFFALSLAGAAIAGVQIVPAYEYVQHSYNQVWHMLDFFGWRFETISKQLSSEDFPAILLSLASIAGLVWSLRRLRAEPEPVSGRAAAWAAAACALVAFSVACWTGLGLDDSLLPFDFLCSDNRYDRLGWLIGVAMAASALWAWSEEDSPGLRALGWLMLGGLAIAAKTPLLSNLLAALPVIKQFHNGNGHRWEFTFALAVLCAAALDRLSRLPEDRAQRLRLAARAFTLAAVFGLGYTLSRPLQALTSAWIPTAIPPAEDGAAAGGFMGGEWMYSFDSSRAFAGWAPALPPPVAVEVVALPEGGRSGPAASAVAATSASSGRVYFHAVLPLTEAVERLDVARIAARIKHADGTEAIIRGPLVRARHRTGGASTYWLMLAVVLLLPALLLLPPIAGFSTAGLLLVASLSLFSAKGIDPEQVPYKLPGLEAIKRDPEPFRVSSLQPDFLKADYTGLYGLHDLRGGDNLDLLTMLYYTWRLTGSLAGDGSNAAGWEASLRLWGLGNVKYMLDRPDAAARPGLEPVYRAEDMSVWRNKFHAPRAAFYDRWATLSVKESDWQDWTKHVSILSPIAGLVTRKEFDWTRTLLLHREPSVTKQSQEPLTAPVPVLVQAYAPDEVRLHVDAPHPGLVFLADSFFPGWQATVNGKARPILRSWVTFRAVEVPAGPSDIRFLYKPFALGLAALLTGLAAAVWALLQWGWWRRRPAFDEEQEGWAAWVERLAVPYVGLTILFWLVWTSVVYTGGGLFAWGARLAAVAAVVYVVLDLRKPAAPEPSTSESVPASPHRRPSRREPKGRP